MGHINVELKTSKGGQIYNQDYISQKIFDHCKVYAIADGMGNGLGGSIASEMAVQSVLEYIEKYPDKPLKQVIVEAIEFANEEIYVYTKYKPEYKGIASTITVVAIDKDYAVVSSIGDSRLYVIRDSQIIFQTTDHTKASEKLASGLISLEQAENDPDKYVLTRAIGVQHVGEITAEELVYLKDDHFLLSTSGLHGELTNEEIRESISNHPLLEAVNQLSHTAESRGKEKYKEYDNLSLAILHTAYSSKLSPHGSFFTENQGVIKTVLGSIAAIVLFFVLVVKLMNIQSDPQADYHTVNQSPGPELVEQTSIEEEAIQPPLEAFRKNEEIELPIVKDEEPEVKMPEIIKPPEEKVVVKKDVKKKPAPPPVKKTKPKKEVIVQNKVVKDPVIDNFTIAEEIHDTQPTTVTNSTTQATTVVVDENYNRSASGATVSRTTNTTNRPPVRRTSSTTTQAPSKKSMAKNTSAQPSKKEEVKKPTPVVLKAEEVTAFVDELQGKRKVLLDLQRKLIPIMARSKISNPKEFTKAKERFQKAKTNISNMESWVKDIQAPVLELSKNQITDIEKKNLFIAVERARQDISIFLSSVKK